MAVNNSNLNLTKGNYPENGHEYALDPTYKLGQYYDIYTIHEEGHTRNVMNIYPHNIAVWDETHGEWTYHIATVREDEVEVLSPIGLTTYSSFGIHRETHYVVWRVVEGGQVLPLTYRGVSLVRVGEVVEVAIEYDTAIGKVWFVERYIPKEPMRSLLRVLPMRNAVANIQFVIENSTAEIYLWGDMKSAMVGSIGYVWEDNISVSQSGSLELTWGDDVFSPGVIREFDPTVVVGTVNVGGGIIRSVGLNCWSEFKQRPLIWTAIVGWYRDPHQWQTSRGLCWIKVPDELKNAVGITITSATTTWWAWAITPGTYTVDVQFRKLTTPPPFGWETEKVEQVSCSTSKWDEYVGLTGGSIVTTRPVTVEWPTSTTYTMDFTSYVQGAYSTGVIGFGLVAADESTGYGSKSYKWVATYPITPFSVSYTIPTYEVSVTVSPPGSGSVSGAGRYVVGSSVTLTAAPASGYRFSHWGDYLSGSENPKTFTMPASDVSVTAYFSDVTPPTAFDLSSPAHDSWVTVKRPTLSWGASSDAESGLKEYRVYVDAAHKKTVTTTSWTLDYDLTEGSHTWYVVAVDHAGNTRTSTSTFTVKVDTVAPTGSILINNDAAYTNSTSVTLNLTYTDATSGVSQVRYSNDGIWDTEPWESPSASKPWTLPAGDGTKMVYYQIKDAAGNLSITYSDSIVLDTTAPPAPSLTSPGDGDNLNTPTPTLIWSTVPDPSAPVTYYAEIDDDSGFGSPNYNSGWISATSWAPPTLPEGLWYWRVRARDNAGNVGSWSGSRSFRVDVATPLSSVDPISPYWRNSVPFTITATASDNGSGVENVELWYRHSSGNLTWGEWIMFGADTEAPWEWQFTAPSGDGYYEFYSIAFDRAGNREPEPLAPVFVDEFTGTSLDTTAWSTGRVGVTLDSIAVSDGKLRLTARAAKAGIYGALYIVSNSPLDFSQGMVFEVQMSVPTYDAPEDFRSEFYLTPDFTTSTNPHLLSDWLRVAAIVDRTGVRWMLQRRVGGGGVGTLYTSGPTRKLDGTWRIDINSENVTVWLDDVLVEPTRPHGLTFVSSYTYLCERTKVAPVYTVTFDYLRVKLHEIAADARAGVDTVLPSSSVDPIEPYWQTSTPFAVTATASDNLSGVASVELYYRHSIDNSTWGDRTSFDVDNEEPYSWSFDIPAGHGFYKFYSIARDVAGNVEEPPAEADARCATKRPTELTLSVDDNNPYWGTPIVFSGRLIDVPGGLGIPAKTVSLYVNNTRILDNVTNANGDFEFHILAPSQPSAYAYRARFAGEEQYFENSSPEVIVEVRIRPSRLELPAVEGQPITLSEPLTIMALYLDNLTNEPIPWRLLSLIVDSNNDGLPDEPAVVMSYDEATGVYYHNGFAPPWLPRDSVIINDFIINYWVQAYENASLALYENTENSSAFEVALRQALLNVENPPVLEAGSSLTINARYFDALTGAAITPELGTEVILSWSYTVLGESYSGSASMVYDPESENYRYVWAQAMPSVPDGENVLVGFIVTASDDADCLDTYTNENAVGEFTFLPWQTMLKHAGSARKVPRTDNVRLRIWARYMFENEDPVAPDLGLNASARVSIDLNGDNIYDIENAPMSYVAERGRYEYEVVVPKPGVDIQYEIWAQADNCEIQVRKGKIPDPVRSAISEVTGAIDEAIVELRKLLGASPPEISPKIEQKLLVAKTKLLELASKLEGKWFWELGDEELQDFYVNLRQVQHKLLIAKHMLEQFGKQGRITQAQLEAAIAILDGLRKFLDEPAGLVAEELQERGVKVPPVKFDEEKGTQEDRSERPSDHSEHGRESSQMPGEVDRGQGGGQEKLGGNQGNGWGNQDQGNSENRSRGRAKGK